MRASALEKLRSNASAHVTIEVDSGAMPGELWVEGDGYDVREQLSLSHNSCEAQKGVKIESQFFKSSFSLSIA